MTPDQRHKLTLLKDAMTTIAAKVGPIHAWWDDIFDIRCVLRGDKPLLDMTVEDRITDAEFTLEKWGYKLPY